MIPMNGFPIGGKAMVDAFLTESSTQYAISVIWMILVGMTISAFAVFAGVRTMWPLSIIVDGMLFHQNGAILRSFMTVRTKILDRQKQTSQFMAMTRTEPWPGLRK